MVVHLVLILVQEEQVAKVQYQPDDAADEHPSQCVKNGLSRFTWRTGCQPLAPRAPPVTEPERRGSGTRRWFPGGTGR